LEQAIAAAYALSPERAQEVLRRLRIFHPYGTVGLLPVKDVPNGVPFGGYEHRGDLLAEIAKGIRTFTEQVHDVDVVASLRNEVMEAEAIVFLGFAFYRQNMELIRPEGSAVAKRVYATAYGISDPDCKVVEKQIRDILGPMGRSIVVRNGLECSRLFDEYWRSFSLT
jgi:hypothetical protein